MKSSLLFIALASPVTALGLVPAGANPVAAKTPIKAKTASKPLPKAPPKSKPIPKATPSPTAGWPIYSGAWFTIKYPRGWKATASHLPGEGGGYRKNTDAAFFTAPDNRAQFYVFSPQWNGAPTGAYVQPKIEVMVSRKQSTSTANPLKNRVISRWWTIRAKDHSYTRSVVDVTNMTRNSRLTFSFRYSDARAQREFAPIFAHFKQSLRQSHD